MKYNFKTATEKDVPEILNMMEQFNSIDNYPFDKEQANENLLNFIANQNLGRLWIIISDEMILGYAVLAFGFSFEYGGRDAFLDELFLKPEFRKKGTGKLAIDFILHQASLLGIKVVHLEVEKHNDAGMKLYKGKGFKNNGRLLLSKKVTNQKTG